MGPPPATRASTASRVATVPDGLVPIPVVAPTAVGRVPWSARAVAVPAAVAVVVGVAVVEAADAEALDGPEEHEYLRRRAFRARPPLRGATMRPSCLVLLV